MNKTAKFIMKDKDFNCEVCHKQVKALGYSARNHCPYCLSSKHVDNNPGDRACNCHGILKAIAIDPFKKGQYKIVSKCQTCGEVKRNITAVDDNLDLIIQIMSNPK